jgi:hypothetical protein
MRSALLVCSLLFFLYICFQPVCAQTATSAVVPGALSAKELRYDVGTIANGLYSNECFGFSIAISAVWNVADSLGNAQGKALHLPGGALQLLVLQKDVASLKGTRLLVFARPVTGHKSSAEDILNNASRTRVGIDAPQPELIHATHPVTYGGRQFFRADYKQATQAGDMRYVSNVLTTFRGYYLGGSLMADSPEQLEQGADLLKTISFQEDIPNSNCVIGPDEYAGKWGVIGSLPRGIDAKNSKLNPAQRIRVSMGVAQSLLVTRVEPEYRRRRAKRAFTVTLC